MSISIDQSIDQCIYLRLNKSHIGGYKGQTDTHTFVKQGRQALLEAKYCTRAMPVNVS